jgi:hypothetical protein
LTARFFGRHARTKIVLNMQLKMALDFVAELPILAFLVEQAAKSENDFA